MEGGDVELWISRSDFSHEFTAVRVVSWSAIVPESELKAKCFKHVEVLKHVRI